MTLFASPRVFELYRRYFNPATSQFLRTADRIPPEGVLDAANVEFLTVVAADPARREQAAARGYRSIYLDELVEVFRRPSLPRYTFTSTYRVGSPDRALEALGEGGAPGVWLESPPSFPSLPEQGAQPLPQVTRFALNEVEIRVDAPRAGLLVCSESHMRGWSATVDGRPAVLQPANYAFRAVEVPAGRHLVRLRYRPPGLTVGLFISAMALGACAAALWRAPASPRPAA